MSWPYPFRLAVRELRGGVRGLRIFLACLVLGVGAIAGVGSLDAAVGSAIRDDARTLFGGDVSARLVHREATPAERQFLDAGGAVSRVALLRAMAVSRDGARHTLIELKAVDGAYPLYGAVALSPRQELAVALAARDGVYGAVVDPAVAARLGLNIGDRFKIGAAELALRATIERVPDAALSGLAFGPGVIVAAAALPQTGLLQPGALVTYDYRVRLAPGTDPAAWVRQARERFPEAGWQLRTAGEASPFLQRFIDRIALFLGLVGVTALLVGGIGIASAVGNFVAGKTATIATLKSLGASSRLVFAVYAVQIGVLATAGIAAGLVLGALVPVAVAPFVATLLPVPLRLGPHASPLATAAGEGLLAVVLFALPPLAAARRVHPGALFRDLVAPASRQPPPAALLGAGGAALALAALVVSTAPDRHVALWYVAGAVVTFAIFRLAGTFVVALARWLARQLARPRGMVLRLALANLHRPGAPTARVVLSLGIGLTVLVAVAAVQASLGREIETSIAEGAPADFFLDIQPAQRDGFAALVHAVPRARMEEVPMLRGRITRLNGVPVEAAHVASEAQWALRSDRGLTYAAQPPKGSALAAGSWWPADYHGPPLVSFDAGLARGMGLKVGDTLSVNVLGREITATIANLRSIEWTHLGINFAIVFAPGALEAAPHTVLAAVWLPQGSEESLVGRVVEQYPNISAIPVREALDAVERVVAAIGMAIRLAALVTLVAGALVLGGAVAADYRRRVYEAVVLKVLGAERRTLAAAFLAEYGLMGLAAAVIAALLGTLIAWLLVTGPLAADWHFAAAPLALLIAAAVGLTMALGFAGTWRALGVAAGPRLRHDA
ncbi:MAG TPA: FtsX-like permease family protein [Stellaceae bacterium]|nr:FtsX-like permease family protein [Stellaceae bacterium]